MPAIITNCTSEMGRSAATVLCECGYCNLFYIWSWSGHGRGRCQGCKSWIMRQSLEVVKPDQLNAYFKAKSEGFDWPAK